MLRRTVLSFLLTVSIAHAGDTFRYGSRVVVVGDSASKLADIVGEPAYKEPIESKEGGREGERWQYSIDHKTVTFEIRNGKVAGIDERRE